MHLRDHPLAHDGRAGLLNLGIGFGLIQDRGQGHVLDPGIVVFHPERPQIPSARSNSGRIMGPREGVFMSNRYPRLVRAVALAFVLVLAAAGISCSSAGRSPATEKTPVLADWEALKYGMFIHFGMSTFTGDEFGGSRPSRPSTTRRTRRRSVDSHRPGRRHEVRRADDEALLRPCPLADQGERLRRGHQFGEDRRGAAIRRRLPQVRRQARLLLSAGLGQGAANANDAARSTKRSAASR